MKEYKEINIVFVEDNPDDADLTIRTLKRHNLANDLVHLTDGQQALDFMFARNEYADRQQIARPKVILLDLKMPKVDGLEVLEALKQDERTRKIPVVVLTSSQQNPDINKCYELGANSYIVKPVNFKNFSEAIADIGMYWLAYNENADS